MREGRPMFEVINPLSLGAPKGFSHGLLGPAGGRVLFVAGMVGWDKNGRFVDGFLAQFALALDNVLEVVKAAGGAPESVGRLTIYVVDKAEYSDCQRELGRAYRERMGRHFPAMALLEVKSLLEPLARLEIEATAVI